LNAREKAVNAFVPKIVNTERETISPWLQIIRRDVQMLPGQPIEQYLAVGQPDYLVALAVKLDSRILLVRQFRPAIDRFSLEFPAGLLEPGETPLNAITRELLEETGYPAEHIEFIGKCATSAGRISNSTYSFFVKTGERIADFREEPGLTVTSVTPAELGELITSGEFSEQCHLGAIALAIARGLITL
jgi:8-oxo-dGTP pyrophosphatase MutT (NUDIX family)